MKIRFGFAGDRKISVDILDFLIKKGFYPECLILPDPLRATHTDQLIARDHSLTEDRIIHWNKVREEKLVSFLESFGLDFIFCIHFPHILPVNILSVPRHGVLNLHPAYLPFNRGWNTPTWAIYDGTPFGATLHFMDTDIDTGDIIHQKQLAVKPDDTADSLYQRVLLLEVEVFQEAWPGIVSKTYERIPHKKTMGTKHMKSDLSKIQAINLDKKTTARKVLNQIRALTTNQDHESAYFDEDGKRYLVTISITSRSQEEK